MEAGEHAGVPSAVRRSSGSQASGEDDSHDVLAMMRTIFPLELPALADRYECGATLGEGRFSRVLCAHRKGCAGDAARHEYALKEIALSVLEEDEEAREMLEAEVAALRRAAEHAELHTRVVRLHEVICTEADMWLVMDRVVGDELFNVVERDGPLAPPVVCALMGQLTGALERLHAIGVVHRDIKPENLMVEGVRGGRNVAADLTAVRLVLIDFGYAAIVDDVDGAASLSGVAGSPEYAAPEVLSWLEAEIGGDEANATPYGPVCDVWSCGVTAYVLLCAALPCVPAPSLGDLRLGISHGDPALARGVTPSPPHRQA